MPGCNHFVNIFYRQTPPRPFPGAVPAGMEDALKPFKLHLIRHGLTRGNLDGLYVGGGTDLPLCDEGRQDLDVLTHRVA